MNPKIFYNIPGTKVYVELENPKPHRDLANFVEAKCKYWPGKLCSFHISVLLLKQVASNQYTRLLEWFTVPDYPNNVVSES